MGSQMAGGEKASSMNAIIGAFCSTLIGVDGENREGGSDYGRLEEGWE
jgi:hypothetical protein